MRVLVLGGNGFIGSHVVDELLLTGYDVSIFDRSPDVWRAPLTNVDYYYGSFSDTSLLAEALEGVDVVMHLISTTTPKTSNLDPIADIQNNLIDTIKLLQIMHTSNIRRIIYFSSGGVIYGAPTVSPTPETHALEPVCSYGVVKVAIEKYLGMYAHLHGFKPMIIRPSNPYGPRQAHQGVQGVISTFMNQIIEDKKIQIWGDGEVKRDYIYITDLAKLCRMVLEQDAVGIINAGSGSAISLNTLLELIKTELKKEVNVVYSDARKYDVPAIALDNSKARNMLGWEPSVSMSAGLSLYHQWIKNNNLSKG
jgi:UDP-glucose 4-epimerase